MEFLDESQIEAFLKKKLSEEERQSFEEEMSRRPELADEVEQYRQAMDFLDAMGDQEMKQKMRRLHQKLALDKPPPKKTRFLFIRLGLGIAATLLLLLIAYWAFPTQHSPEQLYAQYYEAYPLSFSSRDSGTDIRLSEINTLYGEESFEELPALLDKLLAEKEDTKIRLALGISQMELGLHKEALKSFQPLIDQSDPLYFDHALWYSALTQLKLGSVQKATKLLERQTKDSPFANSTKELLSEIK